MKDIKPNHRFRYEWVRDSIHGEEAIDAGCGIGYGSSILASGGSVVTGLEFNPGVVDEARRLWTHQKLNFLQWDLCGSDRLPSAPIFVAFEVLEHLVIPERFLCSVEVGKLLFGSVPSDGYLKHTILVNPFHIQHYTYEGLERLLTRSGYGHPYWYHQDNSEVVDGCKDDARTLIFKAVRTHETKAPSVDYYAGKLLRELSRRSNVINDLKNGNRKPRAATAF